MRRVCELGMEFRRMSIEGDAIFGDSRAAWTAGTVKKLTVILVYSIIATGGKRARDTKNGHLLVYFLM